MQPPNPLNQIHMTLQPLLGLCNDRLSSCFNVQNTFQTPKGNFSSGVKTIVPSAFHPLNLGFGHQGQPLQAILWTLLSVCYHGLCCRYRSKVEFTIIVRKRWFLTHWFGEGVGVSMNWLRWGHLLWWLTLGCIFHRLLTEMQQKRVPQIITWRTAGAGHLNSKLDKKQQEEV